MIKPRIKLTVHVIKRILEFLRPEYLKILSSLLLNSVMKNNWVEIKKINGNISNINAGEFRRDKYIGKKALTFISLKKSSSVNKFKKNIKLNITAET